MPLLPLWTRGPVSVTGTGRRARKRGAPIVDVGVEVELLARAVEEAAVVVASVERAHTVPARPMSVDKGAAVADRAAAGTRRERWSAALLGPEAHGATHQLFTSLPVFWHLRADGSQDQPETHVEGRQTLSEQVEPMPLVHDEGHLMPMPPQFCICRAIACQFVIPASGKTRCARRTSCRSSWCRYLPRARSPAGTPWPSTDRSRTAYSWRWRPSRSDRTCRCERRREGQLRRDCAGTHRRKVTHQLFVSDETSWHCRDPQLKSKRLLQ